MLTSAKVVDDIKLVGKGDKTRWLLTEFNTLFRFGTVKYGSGNPAFLVSTLSKTRTELYPRIQMTNETNSRILPITHSYKRV